jgi:SPP1 gp7 family putative phage head morphogenesis protein
MEPEIEFIFNDLPFEEALKFIRSRIPMTEAEFKALARRAKSKAFSVSSVAGLDALREIRDSLGDAIEKGWTLAEWKRDVSIILKHWDVEGYRAETIYRTNLQSAYQAGRYEQMSDPDVLEMRPYWRYVAVIDDHTRPEHAAMHGKVFPADDPIWDVWYPPNGFNCFPAGTSIRTDLGDIPIEQIRPGVKILTHKGRYRMATNIHKSHHAQGLVRVTGGDGTALTLTANHKVLTPRGWIEAQHLKEGDEIVKAYLDNGRYYIPKSVLIDMYCVSRMPLRKIAHELDINFRTVLRLFIKYEIPKRAFEETIKLQWIGNAKRKNDQAEFAYKKIAGKKHKTGAYLKCPVCEIRFYAQKNEIARGRTWCSTVCAAIGGAYASDQNRACAV